MTVKSIIAPTQAMVLAAGLGLRMRPITNKTPKPLIKVNKRTLIDHALDRLVEGGVTDVVVNLHYFGEQIERHLGLRNDLNIAYSWEAEERLETGGGIKQALKQLGPDPFWVVNSDSVWLNGPTDTMLRMRQIWNEECMDGLLLLHSTVDAYGYNGKGDFNADAVGKLTRKQENEVTPWLYTGIQLLHPRLFKGAPDGPFSLNVLYDQALENERLYGMVHDGEWFEVGTPEGLGQVEEYMKYRYAGVKRR